MSLSLLQNSLVLALLTVVLALGLAVPVALAGQLGGVLWRRWLMAGCVVTLALPGFFVAGMWMEWIGFAGAWRVGWGWMSDRWVPVGVSAGVIALMFWPVGALLMMGAWDRWDRRLLEAEPGLRGWVLLRWGLWPVLRPALLVPGLLIGALALGQFSVPALFQARVWPAEVWVEYATRFDGWGAWVRCWPLGLVAVALPVWAGRRGWAMPAAGWGVTAGVLRRRLGWGWVVGTLGLAGMVFLMGLGVPVLTALLAPRTWVEWEPALRAATPAAVRSVGYAGLAATVVVVVALGTVRWRWMVGAGVLFVVPGVFTGMVLAGVPAGAWLDGVRDAGGMVVSGLVLRGLFPGWWVARRLWEGSGAGLRETVRLAGGGRWAEWRHGVLAGDVWRLGGVWYVVYLLGLWDVETQILVVPPGGDTLALMIFNLLHYGHNAQVTALCVLLGGVALVPGAAIVGLRWLWRVGGRRLLGSGLGGLLVLGASGCGRGDGDGDGAGLRSALFERAEVIGGRGTGPGYFSKPRSVAVDEAGLLYVVDMTGRVQRFRAGGQWEAAWQMPDTARGRAKGMDAAAGGGVWVVEPHYHRVTRYGPDGAVAVQWGERGLEAGRLWFPRAIAAGGDGTCWVTEYGRVERVQRFRMDTGELVGGFGEAGTEPGRLNRAEGLAIGPGGDVYVADSCNHRIQVFSADGRLLRMHGRAGRGIGEFSYPYDVRLDAEGRQYVCEFGNSRIQVFGPDDRPLEVLGGPGTGPTQLNNPWSLCLDKAGNLYVADSLNHRVVRYVRRRGGGGRV